MALKKVDFFLPSLGLGDDITSTDDTSRPLEARLSLPKRLERLLDVQLDPHHPVSAVILWHPFRLTPDEPEDG